MTTDEAIACLKNEDNNGIDLILVRVAGSVTIRPFNSKLQGRMTYQEGDEILKEALQKSEEIAKRL